MTALLLTVWLTACLPQHGEAYLYRTVLVRAAPGTLLELIDLLSEPPAVDDASGRQRPLMMRHSQGDQWDLLLLYPMESFADLDTVTSEFQRELDRRIAWREELFVHGPAPAIVREAFASNAYYHVEMFIALPAKRQALLQERKMENEYLRRIGRPENLIFTRVAGAAWDLYTIGFYRDIKHFAASADIPDERKEDAARAAGFEGADRIGAYLRTLISSHHDTLATAVR